MFKQEAVELLGTGKMVDVLRQWGILFWEIAQTPYHHVTLLPGTPPTCHPIPPDTLLPAHPISLTPYLTQTLSHSHHISLTPYLTLTLSI